MTKSKDAALRVQDYGTSFTPRWWVGGCGFMTRAEAETNLKQRRAEARGRNNAKIPDIAGRFLALRLNMPELAKDKAFIVWLNASKTNCWTWHTKGKPVGEYSDVVVWVDTNGDGSDSDMPEHVWNKLVTAMNGQAGLCWISFLAG